MPKIFALNGFVIYIYPFEINERHHELHIHIYCGSFSGDSMVVQIPELKILANTMKISDAKKAMVIIQDNLSEILEKARDFS